MFIKWCLNLSSTRSLQIASLITWLSQTSAYTAACIQFSWQEERFHILLIYALPIVFMWGYLQYRLCRMTSQELHAFTQKTEIVAARALCTVPLLQDYDSPDVEASIDHAKEADTTDRQRGPYIQVVGHHESEQAFGSEQKFPTSESAAPVTSGINSTKQQRQRVPAPMALRVFGGVWLLSFWLPAHIILAASLAGYNCTNPEFNCPYSN